VYLSGRYKTRYKTPTKHQKFINNFNMKRPDGPFPAVRTTLRSAGFGRLTPLCVRRTEPHPGRRSVARSSFFRSEGGREQHMYYVYLLRSTSSPDKTYIGYSEDLKQHLADH
jgi:hypothetical protein